MPAKIEGMVGRTFGKLTVIGESAERRNKRICYECKCECGNVKIVIGYKLRSGHTRSCGCLVSETIITRLTTHNESNTRLYRIYHAILKRCNNSNSRQYYDYGGRGIKCEFASYKEFRNWSLNNGYNDTLCIDRIDNNGNYSINNCRWTTRIINNRNKRNVHYYQGRPLIEFCETRGLCSSSIRASIRRGTPIERAVGEALARKQVNR